MKLEIDLDNQLINKASNIYESLGLDIRSAIKMFLKRTVLEGKLPIDITSPVVPSSSESPVSDTRKNGTITHDMIEDVWVRFGKYYLHGGNINSIATEVKDATGMNSGSAFIYLTFLDNLIKGKHNTRNMKMSDLEFFINKIYQEMDPSCYENAIHSLRDSLPYWDKEDFGWYAQKVSAFLETAPAIPDSDKNRPIYLHPSDTKAFKDKLLKSKFALIDITYKNGKTIRKEWRADNFKPSSNVLGNLRSRPEFRSGAWEENGIDHVNVTACDRPEINDHAKSAW